jgi:hypothetical protein
MGSDLIFYQFRQSKVERGDSRHFPSLYAPDKPQSGHRLPRHWFLNQSRMRFGKSGTFNVDNET